MVFVAALGVLAVGSWVGFVSPVRAGESPVVVVVGASSPISDISKSALRRAFLAEPTVVAGVKLLPLNQEPGTPERSRFDRTVLDLAPDAMSRFWIDQRLRGQGNPPRAIPSVPLLGKLVNQLPGAICYMKESEVPPGVKVLTVDGKKAGTSAYALR
jgi:hypothetical protein